MALAAERLCAAIGGRTVLEDVSLTFAPGRCTAIIGPNGAGKSTLLRAASGLLRPSGGAVRLDGEDVRAMGRRRLAQKLAILPQHPQAPADLTVARLVELGRFPYRRWLGRGDARADGEAIAWALEETRLSALRDRRVATLSGGERQRAWIAMALAQQPRILLLDEPTTYLDIAHQLEVMQIVRRVSRERRMTVVMVLHDINHALQYADELAVIRAGRLFAHGAPKDILTVGLLGEVFGVRADIFTNSEGVPVFSPVALLDET